MEPESGSGYALEVGYCYHAMLTDLCLFSLFPIRVRTISLLIN